MISGKRTISANGDTELQAGPDGDLVSLMIMHIVATGGFDGNITVKKRLNKSDAPAALGTQYTKEADKSTATAAILAAGLPAQISLDIAGAVPVLTVAGRTAGSIDVHFVAVNG